MQAFDKEGNVFSTVEGLKFQWRIEENPQALRIIPIKEAHFKTSEKKREMERKRFMSDIALLKGIKTGKSRISVQLIEDGYEHVDKAYIGLSVIEPFTLVPNYPIYILPNSEFLFGINRIKMFDKKINYNKVSLPSDEFMLRSDNTDYGTILNTGLFKSLETPATVTVIAEGTAIDANTADSLVHIVPPDQLEIEVFDITEKTNKYGLDGYATMIYNAENTIELEGLRRSLVDVYENNWILVEDRYYLVNMFLFDQSKHKIELTDNLVFNFNVNSEFLEVYDVGRIDVTRKQTSNFYIVKAKKVIYKTPAIGKLAEVRTGDNNVYAFDYERLIVERGIQITSQVQINHPTSEIRLPYLGYHKAAGKSIAKQLWNLQSVGGTENYKWESYNERVALVKTSTVNKNMGEIRGNNMGKTIVKVVDALNPFNYATIEVYVTKVGTLTWLEEKIEREKGGLEDYSHLIAYDEEGKKYTNCSSLIYNLNMRKEDSEIVNLNIQKLNWTETRIHLSEHMELLKLKHRFDEHMDVHYKDQLPDTHSFDLTLQLHNNFGICGSDKFRTVHEGLARVKASLPINYDSTTYPISVEAESLKIASYERPHTISPNYKDLFRDLHYPKQPMQNAKLFSSYYDPDVFKISYGSSLYWVYNGGTNYWADDIYSMEHSVEHNSAGLQVKCLSDNLAPLANRVTYLFSCDNYRLTDLKEYEVSVIMENKQTRSLLRPKRNVAKIRIHCAMPKSVDLWWAQSETVQHEKYQNMPDFVLENNEKTYYLRNNQSKYMRALVFDNHKKMIFNTTSLDISFSSDHPEKLDFSKLPRNDKAIANFKKESGLVKAQVEIKRDIFDNIFHGVTNHKKIKLIEKVKINPELQTKYLHPDNIAEFYIVDGSNNFRVQSNSTDIATLNHLTSINTIELSPENEGAMEIMVEDLGVEALETATAEFLVSDIYRIELIGGGLIEQGNSINLTIAVYDSQNKKFEKDQLKYMDIKPEIEKIGSSRREGLEIIRVTDDTFTVNGVQSGNYRATVVACKRRGKNERISSNYVRIEVFDIVRIVPDSILLFPGGRWTIQVEGGPHGGSRGSVYREYEIEDTYIGEIDEYGEVLGKHVGESWLHLKLYYKSNNQRTLLASRKIKVRVALITSIEIPMMNERSVFVNSLTRLNVKLKHNKETFLHAIGPLSFEWKTSSSHVYSLSLPSRKDSKGGGSSTNLVLHKADIWNGETKEKEEFSTNFNYSSVVGVANKNGDARVSVKMAIQYPKEYNNEKNFFHSNVRIKVTDKLTMSVPEFIEYPTKEPHIYILPPLSKNKIVTNKDAKVKLAYSIQTGTHYDRGLDCVNEGDEVILTSTEDASNTVEDNPILKIQPDGYIETLDKYGKATVVIEENQSLENQVVMLNIMINQIYSLSIEKPYTALNLPMGSETNLKVTFQEENARSFAEKIEGVELFIENSHPHIVQATLDYYNSTLNLNALGIGEANIKVFTKDNIFDVLRVRVQSSVLPHSPVQLHLGGTVQFVFADKEGSPTSRWTTNNPAILSVDPVYGKAEGRSEGEAQVIYEGEVNLVSVVNVKRVDRIELDPKTKPEFFTNARSNRHYKDEHHLLLNVFLEDGLSEVLPETIVNGKPLIKNNIKMTCETEDTAFAVVFAKVINNKYACILRPQPDASPKGKIPTTIKVTVRATSQYSMSYKTEEVFEIPFVSFFRITSPSKQLNFYADERFKSLDVISNTDFTVDVEGNSDLVNYKIQEKDYENHYEIQFSVPSFVSEEFKDLKVRIANALTDSSETFYLSYYSKPRSAYSHKTTPKTYVEEKVEEVIDKTQEPGASSQLISLGIIMIILFGFTIVVIYFCCIKTDGSNDYDVSDSSFYDSSRERFRSPDKGRSGRKGTSLRSHNRYL